MAAKSSGRINFTKLGIAVIDELTGILRDLLTCEVKPSVIAKKVKSSTTLPKLRLDQELLINKAKTEGYSDFDTTLLYTLLRNECPNIPQPTNGWGRDPGPTDATIGDDIERIRLIRNKVLGHISTAYVSDSEFMSIWAEIEAICQRMENHLGSTHSYVQNLKQLELKSIDEELETTYIEKLQSMVENEKELAEMIHALSSEVKGVKSDVKDVKNEMENVKTGVEQLKSHSDLPELTTARDPDAQHYIECSNCDRNAEHYCNTCNEKVCSDCKKKHESKDHGVVLYGEKMTTESCHIHNVLPYIKCCCNCQIPVCQKCIDEKHEDHLFEEINDFFESKKEEYDYNIMKIKDELLPKSTLLLRYVQSDTVKCKKEIANMLSIMTSNAQALKDIIDTIVAENTDVLKRLENSLLSELEQQEKTMNSHITYLQNNVDEYEKYKLSKQHATIILTQKENSVENLNEIPILKEIDLPRFTDSTVKKGEITSMLGEIQIPKKPAAFRKPRNTEIEVKKGIVSSIAREIQEPKKPDTFGKLKIRHAQAKKKSVTSMKLIPTATKMMCFTAPGVNCSLYISPITADQAWVSDYHGNLALTDMKGNKLNQMINVVGLFGCHTTSETEGLIFLNKENDSIYKVTDNKEKPTFITKVTQRAVRCIYSSPFNGDILVSMRYDDDISRVIRYKKTGQEVHQIQYDNTGQPLYDYPIYITENHINADVCVSDWYKCAVVVVDRDKNYRFSYKGHPQGSVLRPSGISTDTQGHILVSDMESFTVQMTDKDGNFLSFLLTKEEGIYKPSGLSLDVRNSLLWIEDFFNNTVSVYKYKLK